MKKFNKFIALVISVLILLMSMPIYAGANDVILDFTDLFEDPKPEPEVDDTDKDDDHTDVITPDDPTVDDNVDTDTDVDTDEGVHIQPNPDDNQQQEPIVYNTTFSDVTEDKWFYSYVTSLASVGIINGYEDGTFLPQNSITRAEFVKLLAATMGYELTETDEFEDVKNTDWFYTYVSAAVKNGVISKQDYVDGFNGSEMITRKEVAKLVVRAIGAETGKYATPYADTDDQNIVALYTQCIMQGSGKDDEGNLYFYPDSNITRAEISTVMSRLLEYNKDRVAYVQEKMKEYGMTELELLGLPFFKSEYANLINCFSDNYCLVVAVENVNDEILPDQISDNIIQAFTAVSMANPQDFSLMGLAVNSTIYPEKQIIKTYLESTSKEYTKEQLQSMKNQALKKAKQIVQNVFSDNVSYSDFEKAHAIHNYLVQNTEYCQTSDDAMYTAYGALVNGTAVCQGYASAFNLLCELAGVKSYAVWNDNHMWNVVISDGQKLYYDTTWDDPVPDIVNAVKEDFCGLTEQEILKTHNNFDTSYFEYIDF